MYWMDFSKLSSNVTYTSCNLSFSRESTVRPFDYFLLIPWHLARSLDRLWSLSYITSLIYIEQAAAWTNFKTKLRIQFVPSQ
jgi:hypothetical protein